MIINKLTLTSFGKFKNKTVCLDTGFNVIYGQNESGKSTVMNFIYAMLYGFGDSRKKGLTFRERCRPWDGGDAEGSMEVTACDGHRYKIYRKCGDSRKKDIVKVFDGVSGDELEILPEELLGINSATFDRTLYIKQTSTLFSGSTEEIASRLSNMSDTGSENVNFDKALKILDTMRRRIQFTRGTGGELSLINQQLLSLQSRKTLAEKESDEFIDKSRRLKDAYMELEQSKKHYEECCKRSDTSLPLQQAALYSEKQQQYESCLAECRSAKEKLDECEKSFNDLKKYIDAPEGDSSFCFNVILLSLFLIIVSVILSICVLPQFLTISAFGIINIIFVFMRKRKFLSSLDKKYGSHDIEFLTQKRILAEEHRAELSAAQALYKKTRQDCEAVRLSCEKIRNKFISAFGCAPEEYENIRQRADADKKQAHIALISLSEEIFKLETQLSASSGTNMSIINEEFLRLTRRRDELQSFFDAIGLAGKALVSAQAKIQLDFAPMLNQKASEYFSDITGGKYTRIFTNKDMKINVDMNIPRDSELFSGGTVDQMYLSLRLALIDMIFGDKAVPVMCDQIFIQYDSRRKENTLSMLKKLSPKRQIILFTSDEDIISDIPSAEILT